MGSIISSSIDAVTCFFGIVQSNRAVLFGSAEWTGVFSLFSSETTKGVGLMSNVIRVTGNLGGNPERKKVNGSDITEFSIFCDEWKAGKDSELVENGGQWYRVTVWEERLSKICYEVLIKGARVEITGHLKGSTYTNDKGEVVLSLDVSASDVAHKLNRVEKVTMREKSTDSTREPSRDSLAA
jgi:single-strand DNA-binding protein